MLAVVLLCHASSTYAQTSREDVSAQLKVVTDTKADDGFRPDADALGRSVLMGVLEHEASVYLEVTLDARKEYHVSARCDTGCSNIDLRLLGPEFDPVAEDTLDNDAPKMDLKPSSSGPHLLAVKMTNCAAQICYFGVVILSRPVGVAPR